MASRFNPRVRRKCTVDAVGDGPAAHVKVKGVGVGQFKKLVVAVGALLGARVLVDFGQDGVVAAGFFARRAVVCEQNEEVVVVNHVVAVQVGMALAMHIGQA